MKLLALSFIFVGLTYFFYKNVNILNNNKNECDITNNQCVFHTNYGSGSVEFLDTIVAEEELRLKFEIPEDLKIKKSWIEGINMYMGITPIMFDFNNNIGVTFIGSCSYEEMKWRLHIELEHKKSRGIFTHTATFSSYQ